MFKVGILSGISGVVTPTVVITGGLAGLTITANASLQTVVNGAGNVTSDGGSTVTSRGVRYSFTDPTLQSSFTSFSYGSGLGAFTISNNVLAGSSGTNSSKICYYAAFATNANGTGLSPIVSFTTFAVPSLNFGGTPTITSTSVDFNIATTSQVFFNFGDQPITEVGVIYSNNVTPTLANGTKVIGTPSSGSLPGLNSNVLITGLTPNTPYYFRAYAYNAAGLNYASALNVRSFTTLP